eukprot:TRINITY_DN15515_c0_g1_i1.p1 TRINITY_DN15515_c0_g1~~TRINITY_DN15515_c0_g1_i1.p1  ORF type:complete len:318 (+),score=77.06 TRINITY_DN15515_c0_g1_i1:168-1121(+)
MAMTGGWTRISFTNETMEQKVERLRVSVGSSIVYREQLQEVIKAPVVRRSKTAFERRRTGSKESNKSKSDSAASLASLGGLRPGTSGRDGSAMKTAGRAIADQKQHDLVWIARANNLSLDVCKQAADVFKCEAGLDEVLTHGQFANLLCKATGKKQTSDIPAEIVDTAFTVADKDGNGTVDFNEFCAWFGTVGFNELTNLSSEDIHFREFCKENSMLIVDVEKYRKYFNQFDTDGSGLIDREEFEELLKKCSKLPKGVDLPQNRVKQLWQECDTDGSGEVNFEEFAVFYKKHFDDGSDGNPWESFYSKVRPKLGATR